MQPVEQYFLWHTTLCTALLWLAQCFRPRVHWAPCMYFIRLAMQILMLNGSSLYDCVAQKYYKFVTAISILPPLYFLTFTDEPSLLDIAVPVFVTGEMAAHWCFFHMFLPCVVLHLHQQQQQRTVVLRVPRRPMVDPTTLREVRLADIQHEIEELRCSVCQTDFDTHQSESREEQEQGDAVNWCRMPKCRHLFHWTCARAWLQHSTLCPNCLTQQV